MENKGADLVQEPRTQYRDVVGDTTFGKQKSVRGRCLLVSIFYSGAVSAALIVLAVLGSIHVNKIEENCPPVETPKFNSTGQWKDYTEAYRDETNETDGHLFLNSAANKQMMNDGNGSVTVIDFNRGMTGYYIDPIKSCYLSGGLDTHMATAEEMEKHFLTKAAQKAVPANDSETLGEVEYVSAQLVKDVTMLPTELLGMCVGKPTSWLNKNITQLSELDVPDNEAGATGSYQCRWRTVKTETKLTRCKNGWWRRRRCYSIYHATYTYACV